MDTTTKKHCNECPFRRTSAAGYLGADKPVNFLRTLIAEHPIPCHKTVNYEKKNWKRELEPGGTAQFCAGAYTFQANRCVMAKDKSLPKLKSDHTEVFSSIPQFLGHHGPFHGMTHTELGEFAILFTSPDDDERLYGKRERTVVARQLPENQEEGDEIQFLECTSCGNVQPDMGGCACESCGKSAWIEADPCPRRTGT